MQQSVVVAVKDRARCPSGHLLVQLGGVRNVHESRTQDPHQFDHFRPTRHDSYSHYSVFGFWERLGVKSKAEVCRSFFARHVTF